jgi:hypothetical protein
MPRYQANELTKVDAVSSYCLDGALFQGIKVSTASLLIPNQNNELHQLAPQVIQVPKLTELKIEIAEPINPDIQPITNHIRSGQASRIVVLIGAGISTGAGTPESRSPATGLYDKLSPLKLPYPEAIFHISYFSHTPEPFYAIARAHHSGDLKPVAARTFLAQLAKKKTVYSEY